MRRDSKILCDDYLSYIRSKPCLISGVLNVDAHHLMSRGRGSAKQNDFTAIPLNRGYHQELHKIGPQAFEAKYGVNLWRESWWLLLEWNREKAA